MNRKHFGDYVQIRVGLEAKTAQVLRREAKARGWTSAKLARTLMTQGIWSLLASQPNTQQEAEQNM